MGTHLQTIPTTMQKIWPSFILTRTNFFVGALDLLFSYGVPLLGLLSLVIKLPPLSSWFVLQFLVPFLVSSSMVKSHSLHFHTLLPSLPGWILFLPFLQLPAWRRISLYQFLCHLSWPNTSFLPIIPGGCRHIPWTFEIPPKFLGCQILCRPEYIPPVLLVRNRCSIPCARGRASCSHGTLHRLDRKSVGAICHSWDHHQSWNPTLCTFIHCHRASWVELCF